MADRFQYLEGVQKTGSQFWLDQIDSWKRIWKRVKGDNYTFGNLVRDSVESWDGWMYGMLKFASLPMQQSQNVVPTVVISPGPQPDSAKGEVPAPDDFNPNGGIQFTKFSAQKFEDAFLIEPSVKDSSTVLVVIKAKGGKDLGALAGSFRGESAGAFLYQGDLPVARLVLAFKD